MGNSSNIVIIDSNDEEIMQLLTFMEEHYQSTKTVEAATCIEQVVKEPTDLILLDDMLYEPNCYDICHQLKSDPQTHHIPILLLSDLSADALDSEIDFIGSDDYICKPIKQGELLEKIDTLLSFSKAH